jgi:hypothetical protein
VSADKRKLVPGGYEDLSPIRLTGVGLAMARIVWLAVAAATVVLFALSLAPGYRLLGTVCTERPCGPEQLSPAGARAVGELGLSLGAYAAYNVTLVVVFALLFWALALVIFLRRSDDPVALYTSLTLFLSGVFLPEWVALLVPIYPSFAPVIDLMNAATYCCLFILFYVFPDGRFVPRWGRWAALAWVLLLFPYYPFPGSSLVPANWSPLALALMLTALIGSCFVAQVYRYRRVSGLVERQQTKWVIFGLSVTLAVQVAVTVPPLFAPSLGQPGTPYDLLLDFFSFWAVLLVPATLGIAILQRRLFDIDVVVNLTLVYGLLTAALIVVYAGGVASLQTALRALSGQDSQLAVVASTLVIAALFLPLRRGIQTFIDRRFYRKKYDARETLAAFAARLRNETDIGNLSGDLTDVVRETVRPAHVSLWLRPGPGPNGRVTSTVEDEFHRAS